MKSVTGRPAAPAPTEEPHLSAGAEARREALLHALGRTVRSLRAAQGLSQQGLAARAGLSPRFVAQLEAGAGNISVAKLAELARALAVPPAALLGGPATTQDTPPGPADDNDTATLRAEIFAALQGRSAEALRALLETVRQAGGRATEGGGHVSVALLGLRGAGKSTLGPLLARALERRFVELDDEIQAATGLAASEIFELHGEDYYRTAERQALERLLARGEPQVVAVSGGAVTDGAVFHLLRERFLTVWVRATPEQHMGRVAGQGDQRPMADRPNAMAELRALLRARVPYYEQARLVADTSAEPPGACVDTLVAQLRQLGL